MTKEEARQRLAGRHYFEACQGLLRVHDLRLIAGIKEDMAQLESGLQHAETLPIAQPGQNGQGQLLVGGVIFGQQDAHRVSSEFVGRGREVGH